MDSTWKSRSQWMWTFVITYVKSVKIYIEGSEEVVRTLLGRCRQHLKGICARNGVGGRSSASNSRWNSVNTSLAAISMVAPLPVIIEAYDTPVLTNEIMTSFLCCGRLRALCKAFCSLWCLPPFAVMGFPLTISRALWMKRTMINTREKLSRNSEQYAVRDGLLVQCGFTCIEFSLVNRCGRHANVFSHLLGAVARHLIGDTVFLVNAAEVTNHRKSVSTTQKDMVGC